MGRFHVRDFIYHNADLLAVVALGSLSLAIAVLLPGC